MIRKDRVQVSTTQKGKLYEEKVATYLQERGYQIIRRNYRCRWGELDIIAKRDNEYHFVEVKGQQKDSHAEMKINLKKRQRIISASQGFIYQEHLSEGNSFHYDVAIVTKDEITYYQNAFEE